MALYVLKQYDRGLPGISAGVMVAKRTIKAADPKGAQAKARKILNHYQPPRDFVVLWDADGKTV